MGTFASSVAGYRRLDSAASPSCDRRVVWYGMAGRRLVVRVRRTVTAAASGAAPPRSGAAVTAAGSALQRSARGSRAGPPSGAGGGCRSPVGSPQDARSAGGAGAGTRCRTGRDHLLSVVPALEEFLSRGRREHRALSDRSVDSEFSSSTVTGGGTVGLYRLLVPERRRRITLPRKRDPQMTPR